MLPKTLALIDDDAEYAGFLAQHLRDLGIHVRVYGDSNDLLADGNAHRFDFYVIDLMLPGVHGVELIKILRKRNTAGVLVVSGQLGSDVFRQVIAAGADMYLTKPVELDQVATAVLAVHRRVATTQSAESRWRLDRVARTLVAPDGARVDLSDSDVAVMEGFVEASGDVVSREDLRKRLGLDTTDEGTDAITAYIYRLRRRIERATPSLVPLQSRSRIGYVFRAPLVAE
jgi:two-component system OmpR family response regulator